MRVGLFVTCLVDQIYPQAGLATLRLLRFLGLDVVFDPRQTCCGQPAFNTGYRDEARCVAETALGLYADCEAVVAPSGSCVAMLKFHVPELFAGSPELQQRAEALARKTWELSDFIVNRLGVTDVGAKFEHRVAFHDSCHTLRELGIREEPRRLLREVRGLELVELTGSGACCGFGGTFSVKFPDVSAAMGRDKVRAIRDSGARFLAGTDVSCLMHLQGLMQREGVPVETRHLAEILVEEL
ncbi:MAG: (Fe-S)-binding protein [Acidobacteriota bacterium]